VQSLQHITRTIAPALRIPAVEGVPRFAEYVLLALADVESQRGLINIPRYEPHWYTRLTDQARQGPPHEYHRFEKWIVAYGKQVACSWGPWQLMAFNAYDSGYRDSPSLLSLPEVAAVWSVAFFNAQRMTLYLDPNTMHLFHPMFKPAGSHRVDLGTLQTARYADRLPILAVIADTWNSGNSTDTNVPQPYIQKLIAAYLLEEAKADG